MIRKLPEHGTLRHIKKFALVPVKTDDGYFVWLDWYTRTDRYNTHHNYWETKSRLYKEQPND